MNVIREVEFLRLAPSLLCCGLLALLLAGCADDAARLMYRSQSELTRHRRMEAESAARERATKQAADKLQKELAESVARERATKRAADKLQTEQAAGEAQKRAAEKFQAELAEGEAQDRTLDQLQAALTVCLRAGGTYEVCYHDQAAYLTCLAAGGRDAECRPQAP